MKIEKYFQENGNKILCHRLDEALQRRTDNKHQKKTVTSFSDRHLNGVGLENFCMITVICTFTKTGYHLDIYLESL